MLERKHFTGPPETGHHFVKNQESVMLVAPLSQTLKHARGPDPHTGSTLHEWFDNDGGGSLSFEALQIFDGNKAFDGKLVASKTIVELSDSTETRRSERVSVISIMKCSEIGFLRLSILVEILASHLDGDLNAG